MPVISNDNPGGMSDADSNASEQSVKRKMIPSMSIPKESSSRNESGSNIMSVYGSGKYKKQNKRYHSTG